MTPEETRARIAALEGTLAARLNSRRRPLAQQLAAAGHRLPRAARARAVELMEADARLAHPATAHRTDLARIHETCEALERDLARLSARYVRRDWSAAAGVAGLRLVALGALVTGMLIWRGFL